MNRTLGPVYMVAKTVGFLYMPGNSAGQETRLAGKLASILRIPINVSAIRLCISLVSTLIFNFTSK